MPDVRDRIRNRNDLTHYSTQFLTGHGNIMSYLNRFGFCETDKCKWCGISDTPEPVSYTHLDVYKRQDKDCSSGREAGGEIKRTGYAEEDVRRYIGCTQTKSREETSTAITCTH